MEASVPSILPTDLVLALPESGPVLYLKKLPGKRTPPTVTLKRG